MRNVVIFSAKDYYLLNDLLKERDFVKVGYIGGIYGHDGSVRLSLEPILKKIPKREISFFYFMENGMFVPRFIRTWDKKQSLISFQRITAREDARMLTDQNVYLRRRDLPASSIYQDTSSVHWELLNGYQLIDIEKDVLIGVIETIEEYPGGWMAIVVQEDRSEPILIPLAGPLIDHIDEENQILYMDLPEGLDEI